MRIVVLAAEGVDGQDARTYARLVALVRLIPRDDADPVVLVVENRRNPAAELAENLASDHQLELIKLDPGVLSIRRGVHADAIVAVGFAENPSQLMSMLERPITRGWPIAALWLPRDDPTVKPGPFDDRYPAAIREACTRADGTPMTPTEVAERNRHPRPGESLLEWGPRAGLERMYAQDMEEHARTKG
jgi:hypothetical protein